MGCTSTKYQQNDRLVPHIISGNVPLIVVLTFKQFVDIGGSRLLRKFNKSPYLLLSNVFPEYEWLPWKFDNCPRNYWDDVKNQKKFMDWAAEQLNIQEMGDWYKVTKRVTKYMYTKHLTFKQLDDIGGNRLLVKYNLSPSLLLYNVYPDYDWLTWKFDNCPRNYWDDVKNQRNFMDWVGKQLNIIKMSDWYNITEKVKYFCCVCI
jgi:hypothetical protein